LPETFKAGERFFWFFSRLKTKGTVVYPAKAGIFNRRQICQSKENHKKLATAEDLLKATKASTTAASAGWRSF